MKMWKWIGRGVLSVLLLWAAANLGGYVYERAAEARDAKAYPPPGKLVRVGSRTLHMLCKGTRGGTTVVHISGGGTASVVDYPVQDRVARFARDCTYDRPGLGWSPRSDRPLGLEDHVADLHALLKAGGEKGPYVLVPDSFGGLIAVTYAARYPEEVAGLVLVDAMEPRSWFAETGALLKNQPRVAVGLADVLARVGVVRALLPHQHWPFPLGAFTPQERGQFMAIYSRPNPGRTEAYDVYERTLAQARIGPSAGVLGDRPLIAIRHGEGFTGPNKIYEAGWAAAQARLVQLSSRGRSVVARASGHEINLEAPDLVAQAIKEVVAQIQPRGPRAPPQPI